MRSTRLRKENTERKKNQQRKRKKERKKERKEERKKDRKKERKNESVQETENYVFYGRIFVRGLLDTTFLNVEAQSLNSMCFSLRFDP